MSAATRAPPEVLHQIFDGLPRPRFLEFRPRAELLQLFFVCRAWHAVAEAVFYHHIKLGDFCDPWERADAAPCPPASAFRAAVLEHPRLGRLVHSLDLSTLDHKLEETQDWTVIIPACSKLQRLSIRGWNGYALRELRFAVSCISTLRSFTISRHGLRDMESDAFGDRLQMFELLRRWPQLEEVDVGTAVMAYGGPPRRKKNAPPNVDPDIIWDSVYDLNTEYWMCKNRDEMYENDPNPSYDDAWIPAFPAIVPGAWPQLRKIAGDVLDDSVFAALPIMAPNLEQFTPSYTPLGPALNAALASWGHSLRRIYVRAGSSFEPGRRPDGVALGSTFAALHMLERAEVDSWTLPAAHFVYLPPSLRELQYLSSRNNLAELVASRTLEQPNTASGLRKFVVNKLDSVALAMPDVESLTMVCAKRYIEVKIDKMHEDELIAMIDADYEAYEGRFLDYREFNWRKWRLQYLGDDCRDLEDEEEEEEEEEEEDYDDDYDEEDEDEEDEGGDSGDEQ